MNNIIVIGGTSGLGHEVGLKLLDKGYEVTLAGRNKPKTLKSARYKFIDVTDETCVKKFFQDKEITSIDGIIYSAGISSKKKSINRFDQNIYKRTSDVNLLGAILTLKYGYKFLKKSKGRVVIINSLAARSSSKFSGIEYTVTKSGLSGMVKHLALDWASDNVLINSIFPSMIDTPMLRKALSKEELKNLSKQIPLQRVAKTSDMLGIIEFLISKENTYITGAGIDINGGQYLSA